MNRRMAWGVLLGLAVSVALIVGCSGSDGPAPARQDITATQLEAMMADGQPLVILDVRTPGEFAGGHIAGSINIPVDELSARAGELGSGERIAVVCGSGIRSEQGADLLCARGFAHVYNLLGGLQTWPGELVTSG